MMVNTHKYYQDAIKDSKKVVRRFFILAVLGVITYKIDYGWLFGWLSTSIKRLAQ